ncbi:MAG: long-chain fatty acid--CoA ligase [Micrococcales bacterium]|nr:long-chain fatty acid--CoA ligase [Micrococcales bacterium]
MTTMSLASILAEPARRTPDKVAVVESGEHHTYAQVWERARRVAASLRDLGMAPGERVAILGPNVVDFVWAYYGVQALGGVVVPVPSLLSPDEAAYILRHSGARMVLYHSAVEALARPATESVGLPLKEIRALAEHATPVEAAAVRDPDDTAVIFYTSGTTGRPKGAELTHLNLVMNATANAFDANPIARDDIVMGCLPLFHVFGQSVSMNSTFRAGATLVLQPRFHPAEAIDLMVAERTNLFFGVPTMYVQLLAAAPDAAALPQLKDCISGGAALPVAVLEKFTEVFGANVFEGYGLSETSPTCAVNQPWFGTRAGTVGHPIWGVEVEIADETIEDEIRLMPTDALGEIVVRGHCVFKGYLDNPEATAQAIVDGWFRTGDIGRKDEDGFIWIVDRKKDLIIRGGFNVYPREVEEVLARFDGVSQVAVIGIPDAERGEEVMAVVTPVSPGAVDAEELLDYGKAHLAKHKYPRRVEVVDALPLGPTHKILKRELRAQYVDG